MTADDWAKVRDRLRSGQAIGPLERPPAKPVMYCEHMRDAADCWECDQERAP